ncbi:MAG: hypothetical protein M1817_005067 [Caeruleum heppii]|nr:MAG: hypothetical protein M1817_005067 [Caeruleum heppii]
MTPPITSTLLRRALLYVPASSPRMLRKTSSLTVDLLTYDLEDSVTPAEKPAARRRVAQLLREEPKPAGVRERAVRINSIESGGAEADLVEFLKCPNLDALVIPKVNSASDLHFVTDMINHHLSSSSHQSPPPKKPTLLALLETGRSILSLPQICTSTPLLTGLIFGAEDFARSLSLTRTPSLREFLYARSAIVTACSAFDIPSCVDLVCTEYKGPDAQRRLREESEDGRGMGFNGKQCVHPDQLRIVQEAFSPKEEEVRYAVRVLVAAEKAEGRGKGSWGLDGRMVDRPVVERARAVVERARLCGVDTEALRETWRGQEPE